MGVPTHTVYGGVDHIMLGRRGYLSGLAEHAPSRALFNGSILFTKKEVILSDFTRPFNLNFLSTQLYSWLCISIEGRKATHWGP